MNSSDRLLDTIQGCAVVQHADGRVEFVADADIDADGAYRAYHPISGRGLDHLANAGSPGDWWGIVTVDGKPVIQGASDPAPGYYVSATSYEHRDRARTDPRRYLDSETIPFCVVGNSIRQRAKGVVLGCRAKLTNIRNGRSVEAIVGDMGPLRKIGELSIAAARALGLDGDPRTGGTSDKIIRYELWPDVPAMMNGVTYQLQPA